MYYERVKQTQGKIKKTQRSSTKATGLTVSLSSPQKAGLKTASVPRRLSHNAQLRSPSQRSSSRQRQLHDQIRQPLADSQTEEAFPEDEHLSSDEACDDLMPITDYNVAVENPRSPKPGSSCGNSFNFFRSEHHATANQRSDSLAQNNIVISSEQLMQMLVGQNSEEKSNIGGLLTINGKNYRILPDAQGPQSQYSGGMCPFLTTSHRPHQSHHFYNSSTNFHNRRNEDLIDKQRVAQGRSLIIEPQVNEILYPPMSELLRPPMNEQRSTDEPILLASRRISSVQDSASHVASRRSTLPHQNSFYETQDRYARASCGSDKLDRENQVMAIGQSLTSQILPKISQTISGGSLQPSLPSDSYEVSPDRELLKKSFKISNFSEIEEQTEKDGSPFEERRRSIQFHPPQLEEPPTGQKLAADLKAKTQPAFEIKADLESPGTEPTPQTYVTYGNNQQIGVSQQNRKKKKKLLQIKVETNKNAVEDHNKSPLPLNLPGAQHYQTKVGKPISPKINAQPTANVSYQPVMQKQPTFVDDLLTQLEAEFSRKKMPIKPRKTSTEEIIARIEAERIGISSKNTTRKLMNLGDLDQEFLKAHLKRNNSDSVRSKDELKSKKIILRELQDLKESLLYQQDQEKSEVDIAFLHASPIYIEGPSEGKTNLVALKFQKEKDSIIEAIKQSEQKVRFRQSVATKDKFIDIIRKRPTCLHISCHGFDQADTSMRLMQEEDQRNLLFETENGSGHLISQGELNKILKQAMTKIKLVFVAACMSDFVGKIFQQCDVPHVICSEQGKLIRDDAAVDFSKFFYTRFFAGEAVCQAFQEAQKEVAWKYNDNEANRFQLMISTGQFKHSKKRCPTRWPKEQGQRQCLSEHIKFKHLRAKITNFIPREIEFYKLICFIQEEAQLAHYRGLPGVGKTYMVRKVLTYLAERKYFTAGILYFALNDTKCVQQFLITLRNRALVFFKLSHAQRSDLCMKKLFKESQIIDFLVDFFEDKAQSQYDLKLTKHKNFSSSKNRRFLLVLDNCEGLISNSGEEFRHLLSYFQDQCKMLKILVVSRNQLTTGDEGEEIQPLILPQLGSKQAVQFFLEVCEHEKRNIGIDEIGELISSQPFYPISKVFKNTEHFLKLMSTSDSISQEARQELQKLVNTSLSGVDSHKKLVEILSYHDLFRLLQGNPTSISRAANIYINQLDKVETLQVLYKMILQNDFSVTEDDTQQMDDTRPKRRLNNESLQATTKLAIDMLPSEASKDLLYFIGLLPAGIKKLQLTQMWRTVDIDNELPGLMKLNLVEKTDDLQRYELNPVLYQFIGQDICQNKQKTFMHMIVAFYAKLLAKIYEQIAINKDRKNAKLPYNSPKSPHHRPESETFSNYASINTEFFHLDELKTGLKKKKDFKVSFNSLSSNGQQWHWYYPGIDIEASIMGQIIEELPNLNRCMDYLVFSNGDSFNSRGDISLHDAVQQCNSGVLLNTLQQKLRMSSRKQSSTDDSLVTPQLEPSQSIQSTASNIKGFQQITRFERISNPEMSPVVRKQAQMGGLHHQNLQRNSARRPTKTLNQGLHVIDELQEKLDCTRTSMQSDESPDKQQIIKHPKHQLLQQQPDLRKDISGPFSISLGQLDSDSTSRPVDISHLAKAEEQLQSKTEDRASWRQDGLLGTRFRQPEGLKSLNQSIGKCDQIINTLVQRQTSNHKLIAGQLDARARNDRQIVEPDDSDSEQSEELLFDRSESVTEFVFQSQNSLLKKQGEIQRQSLCTKKMSPNDQKTESSGRRFVPKSANNIFVSQLHIDSDRKATNTESDGLGSVRYGNDIEDDFDCDSGPKPMQQSRSSDLSNNLDQFNQKIETLQSPECTHLHPSYMSKNFAPDDRELNSGRSNANETTTSCLISEDRRPTLLLMLRRKSQLIKKNCLEPNGSILQDKASATVKLPSASRIEMNRKLMRQVKQLQDLDHQADFKLSKSSHISKNSPKNSSNETAQMHLSSKEEVVDQGKLSPSFSAIATGPSPISQKSPLPATQQDKMSSKDKFIIYTTVNALLVDNVNFAYQVSQTDFSGSASSVLFLGNINRLKALAAEQIFLRNYDEKEEETLHLVSFIIEAVRAATEAYKLYSGSHNPKARSEYGLGLQCFQLGYLQATYASKLSPLRTIEAHEDVCGGMSEEDFKRKARGYFRKAYNHFSAMTHFKGMYMAKQYEVDLYGVSDDETTYQLAMKQAERCKSDYVRYVADHGYSHCCHIPRLHGDEISLLTEIVQDNEEKALFRIPSTSMTRNSSNSRVRRRRSEGEGKSH